MPSNYKKIKQELFILPASAVSACFFPIFLLHFPRRATLFCLKRVEIVQWPRSQPYRQERGVFDMTAENKKVRLRPPFCLVLRHLRLPVILREVKTSRKLPGNLPEKITGSKITGVSRNTRNIYRVVTGWLYGPDRLPGLSRNGPQDQTSSSYSESGEISKSGEAREKGKPRATTSVKKSSINRKASRSILSEEEVEELCES